MFLMQAVDSLSSLVESRQETIQVLRPYNRNPQFMMLELRVPDTIR